MKSNVINKQTKKKEERICIGIRLDLDLISLVYVYLFQNYYTGATMKTRKADVVSV